MRESDGDIAARTRVIGRIANLTWIASLAIFAGIGALGRASLEAQGVAVLSWSRAISYFVPFALLHEVPVLLFALIVYRTCRQAFHGAASPRSGYFLAVIAPSVRPGDAKDFPRLVHAVIGASVGVVGTMSFFLVGPVLHTGPGGFGEAAIMLVAMAPLVLAYYAFFALIAAAVGGLVGTFVYRLLHRSSGQGAP